MSTQVVRIASFTKGSLHGIGNEAERKPTRTMQNRNEDIDPSLTVLNHSFKQSDYGMYQTWKDTMKELNVQWKETKKAIAFEGMVVTADKEFFEELGWHKGMPLEDKTKQFFEESYDWAVKQIGYKGTDSNVLSAVVHLDETTPHLQLYYVPVTEKWQSKVYQKDSQGHVVRNEKGVPQVARNADGKIAYEVHENDSEPRLSRSEFWRLRGAQSSYRQLQDKFHSFIGSKYGLGRGEVGSDRVHKTKAQWEKEQLDKELAAKKIDVANYRAVDNVDVKNLPAGRSLIRTEDLNQIIDYAKAYLSNHRQLEIAEEMRTEYHFKLRNVEKLVESAKQLERDASAKRLEQTGLNKSYQKLQEQIENLKAKDKENNEFILQNHFTVIPKLKERLVEMVGTMRYIHDELLLPDDRDGDFGKSIESLIKGTGDVFEELGDKETMDKLESIIGLDTRFTEHMKEYGYQFVDEEREKEEQESNKQETLQHWLQQEELEL